MDVVFLGTGTSGGIPEVGCSCSVCTSRDPRNRRFRSSVWIRENGSSIVIDTAPEFRLQAVREGIANLDAILYTHPHADHLNGLDDVRPLSARKPIPVFGNDWTLGEVRERFSYIFRATQKGGGKPNIDLRSIDRRMTIARAFDVTPVPIMHGRLEILGYRIGGLAYLTDCSGIPESSYPLLAGLDVLVIGALRYRPHETHFSVEQALSEIERIRPARAFLTHLNHDLDHGTLEANLPDGVSPAFDGLVLRSLSGRRSERDYGGGPHGKKLV